ncbi:MAG: efflux RND transporter permease subunit [Gemmatimonadetes bacterium]|nr:efflux RND transporter permease subunit [Gemmatimonadota bacterium]
MIRLSIRRPVAVAMAYLAVALLGVAAWRHIPIEMLPETQLPKLTVRGQWYGASPETVEAFLTSPVEAEVQQVRGVEKVRSESYQQYGTGIARIDAEFARGTDMDFVRLELSERLAALEDELPPGARLLAIERYVPEEFREQDRPFLEYTLTGPYAVEALRGHVDEAIGPELAEVEGVALVRAQGGRGRVIEIELDERRIDALGLSAALVHERLRDIDLVREAGAVRSGAFRRIITIRNRTASLADIRRTVLTSAGGRLIRLEAVATVRDTYEDPIQHYRIDGRPAVSFSVHRQIGTNAVEVADRVKERVAVLSARKPAGMHLILDHDESQLIRRQFSDLGCRALVSTGAIFLVLLAFLRSFRFAGLVFATIVFSVLIALNFIYFGGFTLNLLTLMGLATGFGLVVDNSIVVLENIYRRWQRGDAPAAAAQSGAVEVVLPVLAATATTLIVLIPFVYLQGELRVYYAPLAMVVGLTLLASLFVAFTFIPSLAARVLAPGTTWGAPAASAGASGPPVYARIYSAVVSFTLRHPWLTMVATAACFAGSYYLFDSYVTRGRLWRAWWDEQTYIDIRINFPGGSEFERTDELARHFEAKLASMAKIERVVTRVTGTYAHIRVTFPDSIERTFIPAGIKEQMLAYSHQFGGSEVQVYGHGPSFYGGGSSPPSYAIQVLGYNYEEVRTIAEDIGRRLARFSRIRDVDTNATGLWYERDRAIQYVVEIDRDALARHHLTVADLTHRLSFALSGETHQDLVRLGDDEVRFEVKLAGYREMDVQALRELLIPTPVGSAVRVDDVVAIRPQEVLSRIRREDQQYERTVAYEFRGPAKLGDLVHEAVIKSTAVPPGYTVKAAERWRWPDEERRQIYGVLALSLVLVYMVNAALFESLRQPLCVLLTVPMALIGVFLIFFYADATFTREAYIGVVMMGGIVVNNAILLVDRVNRLRRQPGLGLHEAIVRGTVERVRPILMTTATTVLGLLPLVLFGESVDANLWNALGYALIGGLLSSSAFVLTTTPAVYLVFERGAVRAAPSPNSGPTIASTRPAAPT